MRLAFRVFLSLVIFAGLPILNLSHAEAVDTLTVCSGAIGASSACPAQSPQELSYLYTNRTNGNYYLNANGTVSMTYFIMDTSTSYGGGNLILLMKGTKTSTNFVYSSNYFTDSSTVLNDSNFTYSGNDVSNDYKSYAFNNRLIHNIIGVFKDPTNSTIGTSGDLGGSNSFSGHTWSETLTTDTNTYSLLTTNQELAYGYSNVRTSIYKDTSGNLVFSSESPAATYGFNANRCGFSVRWGVGWNENGANDFGSCDVGIGIGVGTSGTGDFIYWYGAGVNASYSTTGRGKTGFQIWGRVPTPAMSAPTGLSARTTTSGDIQLTWTAPSGSPTAYVIQCKPTTQATWDTATSTNYILTSNSANPTATISGLNAGTSYNFRVFTRSATDSSPTSASLTATAATVNASNLSNPYTGSSQYSSATTTPGALSLTYTYRGIGSTVYGETTTAPTLIGTYVETITVTDAGNYIGIAVVNLTITNAITNVSLNVGATIKKLLANNLTVTTNTSGLVTYYANGRQINRCVNISSSATCVWKPLTQGTIYLTVRFTPTDSTFPNQTTSASSIISGKRVVSR